MVILDLWGISFHPAVVVGLGNDLLFNSILAHCATVAIAEFFWKMQRKTWYSILGLDAMPLSLKNLLLID
jgi:hypothetical protein